MNRADYRTAIKWLAQHTSDIKLDDSYPAVKLLSELSGNAASAVVFDILQEQATAPYNHHMEPDLRLLHQPKDGD